MKFPPLKLHSTDLHAPGALPPPFPARLWWPRAPPPRRSWRSRHGSSKARGPCHQTWQHHRHIGKVIEKLYGNHWNMKMIGK